MKKIIRSIVAFVLIITISIGGVAPIAVLALDASAAYGQIAYVWNEDYDEGKYYSTVKSAWNAAKEQGNILLLADWKISEALTVPRNKHITVYMNDFSIDRGLNSPEKNGEIFLVNNRSKLWIYATDTEDKNAHSDTAKISGGYNSNGGGAIHVQSDAAVYIYGITITENKTSDSRGGGAIRMHGDSSRLEMNEYTYICNNTAVGTSGGAISIYGDDCVISGGNLISNKADKSGGAILSLGGASASKLVIKNNEAKENGGGAYAAKGGSLSLSGCTVEENNAGQNGGGFCIDGSGSFSGGSVQSNVAGMLGGGAYVNATSSIGLSGDLIVKSNKDSIESSIESDNVYLHAKEKEDSDDNESAEWNMAQISSYPSSGEVHVGWNSQLMTSESFRLSKSEGIYSTKFLISDVEGYFFYWSWDTEDGKNDRYIWADTIDYGPKYSFTTEQVSVSDRYHVIENGYNNEYDLQEGIFGYNYSKDGQKGTVYFYSDGYFADSPTIYNPSLATMSLALANAASNAGGTDFNDLLPNGSYSNAFRNAMMLLSDIGIQDKDIFVNEGFQAKPTAESIGMIMGAKEIEIDGKEYILIPIAVRGGGYESEWANNVMLNGSGEASGFSGAATQVMEHIENYINTNTSFDISKALKNGRVKFWVVGFSRGGAVANITAKRLTDIYGETGNSIYGYSFEAAKGGTDAEEIHESWTYNGIYSNLHNVINPSDLVPTIPPSQMGFKRYGVDHYAPGTDAGEITTTSYTTASGLTVTTHADNKAYGAGDENYTAQRTEMKKHLAILDDSLIFYDYFSLAAMNYLGALSGSDLIGELENGTDFTAGEWLNAFFEDLTSWAADGTYELGDLNNGGYNGDYRDFYSSNSEFAGQKLVTVEEALEYFMELIYGTQNGEEIIEIMTLRLGTVVNDVSMLFDFYFNIVKKWDELSKEKQSDLLDKIWKCMYTDMEEPGAIPIPKITDLVDDEELVKLKSSVYSLACFLFLFISRDHANEPSINDVDTTHVHLGTFLYNASTLLQCHDPDVCTAWLQSYDEHYSANNKNSRFANKEVYLIDDGKNSLPEVKSDITTQQETITVVLSSIINSSEGVDKNSVNNGSAIYYAVYENGNIVGSWQLYSSPIVLDKTKDTEYSVRVFAARFAQKGSELEITDSQLRTAPQDYIPLVVWIIAAAAVLLLVIIIAILKISKKKRFNKTRNKSNIN